MNYVELINDFKMKIFLITLLLGFTLSIRSQDKIITLRGDTIIANVTKVSDKEIEYSYDGESVTNTTLVTHISQITFKSGRIQKFKQKIEIPDISGKDDWEKVIITYDENDLVGLTKVKEISAQTSGGLIGRQKPDAVLKKLKIAAAKMKCGVILMHGQPTYDFLRGYLATGAAYKK